MALINHGSRLGRDRVFSMTFYHMSAEELKAEIVRLETMPFVSEADDAVARIRIGFLKILLEEK